MSNFHRELNQKAKHARNAYLLLFPDDLLLCKVIFPVRSIAKLPFLYRMQISNLVHQITQLQLSISVQESNHMFYCHLGKLPWKVNSYYSHGTFVLLWECVHVYVCVHAFAVCAQLHEQYHQLSCWTCSALSPWDWVLIEPGAKLTTSTATT